MPLTRAQAEQKAAVTADRDKFISECRQKGLALREINALLDRLCVAKMSFEEQRARFYGESFPGYPHNNICDPSGYESDDDASIRSSFSSSYD